MLVITRGYLWVWALGQGITLRIPPAWKDHPDPSKHPRPARTRSSMTNFAASSRRPAVDVGELTLWNMGMGQNHSKPTSYPVLVGWTSTNQNYLDLFGLWPVAIVLATLFLVTHRLNKCCIRPFKLNLQEIMMQLLGDGLSPSKWVMTMVVGYPMYASSAGDIWCYDYHPGHFFAAEDPIFGGWLPICFQCLVKIPDFIG